MRLVQRNHLIVVVVVVLMELLAGGVESATFTIANKCRYTVWPGLLSGAGTEELSTTGLELAAGASTSIQVPEAWSGRVWGRTLCSADSITGKFSCLTADCGSSSVQCSGGGAAPPATLAEFTLNGANHLDFYDVSLVDGYNLAMAVYPLSSNCTATGCAAELNLSCPMELKVVEGTESVGCRSACEAFGDPKYCCSGAYATPDTCAPSAYSQFFKTACPRAYSYAYDDATSTFTCPSSPDYLISFCPDSSSPYSPSVKSSNGQQYPAAVQVAAGLRETTPSLAAVTLAAILSWQLLRLF